MIEMKPVTLPANGQGAIVHRRIVRPRHVGLHWFGPLYGAGRTGGGHRSGRGDGRHERYLHHATGGAGGQLARKSQCAVERRLHLAGAKPARQLSLQPVAVGAVHGGNDMD